MNKAAIEKFAIDARNDLIAGVKQRAYQFGIEQGNYGEDAVSAHGHVFSGEEMLQREQLIRQIKDNGYEKTMEEVAYTWFNRFIALRFMEVNNYLPTHIRVFSDANGAFKPEILQEALRLEPDTFAGLDKQKITEYLEKNQTEDLYRYLLLMQCNALHPLLPVMFDTLKGYMALLLPNNILKGGSVLARLVEDIAEEDFKDAVEIIGWCYQYYNTEPKAEVYAGLKKNVKITKDNIPAATQIFTPDWIVKYMVENSLGRLVISGQGVVDSEEERIKKEKALAEKFAWKYYLPEAAQTPEVRAKLNTTHSTLGTDFNIEDIKIIDPCMGSGHILVYVFDVLMQIYESQGYAARDAVASILENNLFGLDIDERAYQLAYFAIMMKARSYDRRFLTRDIAPQVYCPKGYADGEEYGSLLIVNELEEKPSERKGLLADDDKKRFNEWNFRRLLAQKYDVVVTNPPYMGSSGMNKGLTDFVKENYPDSKSDSFAACIEKNLMVSKDYGYVAMITMESWMFLSSYEKLRSKIIQENIICSLGHFPYDGKKPVVMGINFGTTAFILKKVKNTQYRGSFFCSRYYELQENGHPKDFPTINERYNFSNVENFSKIPGSPIAYWVSEKAFNLCQKLDTFENLATTRAGMITGNNEVFVRLWHEVKSIKIGFKCINRDIAKESKRTWFPYNKGGLFRKWYGNNEYIVHWKDDGAFMRNHKNEKGEIPAHAFNLDYIFKENITWSSLSSYKFSARYTDFGFLYDASGSFADVKTDNILYTLSFLCSEIALYFLSAINPTLNFQKGNISSLPFNIDLKNKERIDPKAKQNISLSKSDWDAFETSWDFVRHPLLNYGVSLASGLGDDYSKAIDLAVEKTDDTFFVLEKGQPRNISLQSAFELWQKVAEKRFDTLKANEEELNRIFIDIYGLQDELTPEVEDKDVTVRLADKVRDIKSFISYAVGCMFGRYSLDREGLVTSGQCLELDWVQVGNVCYKREVVEYYVSEELSRVDSMAEIHVVGDTSVCSSETSSQGRDVCAVRPDEASGSVNTFKYRRGTAKELYKGIHTISCHSERVESGDRNPTYDLCSTEILNAITSGNGSELVSRGWEDAQLIDWQAIHSTLATNHYPVDVDNVVPICDDDYFDDDITGRFVSFVEKVFGENTLDANLQFIADSLGGTGLPKDIIRNYFLNGFYADHCKIYQKRPIYWQFESGKKNGFKALMYMHRYQPDLMARMRTDYVHEQQERYDTQLVQIAENIEKTTGAERVKLGKLQKKLQEQSQEIASFEEKVHHLADQHIVIDLDDGVKHNYEFFKTVVTKIK